jgi:hypothetical protein
MVLWVFARSPRLPSVSTMPAYTGSDTDQALVDPIRYNLAATAMETPNPIDNVPEVLRLALKGPVTVVEGGRQIAWIVSLPYFAEVSGEPVRLEVEQFSEKTLARLEMGSGSPDERSQRFCRLVLHAVHAKTVAPLLVNGQPMAMVVPPLKVRDPSAPPEGPWIRIWRV